MCGIIGIFTDEMSNHNIIKYMRNLEHRGRDGYGIAWMNENKLKYKKIDNLLDSENVISRSCIGHLRYSTSGETIKNNSLDINELQPLYGIFKDDEYCIIHNGNIPNLNIHDTTYINNLISNSNERSIEEALISIINKIPASFSMILLVNNNLYALRDRFGIRPLSINIDNDKIIVSSESINPLRSINPGELIKIDSTGINVIYSHKNSQLSLCSFELIYFMNEKSITDNILVSNVRENLAKQLAKKEKYVFDNDYIVIGIPMSGILYGKIYAAELNLHYHQAITKNKDSKRTFILLNNDDRISACEFKFNYDIDYINNKKIIIVDDTIVRGNVIKNIIKNLKLYNALEIHIRIPSPPVIDICELGIAINSKEELLMNNHNIQDLKYELNIDSIEYLEILDLNLAGIPKNSYNQYFTGYIDPEIKNYNQKKEEQKEDKNKYLLL